MIFRDVYYRLFGDGECCNCVVDNVGSQYFGFIDNDVDEIGVGFLYCKVDGVDGSRFSFMLQIIVKIRVVFYCLFLIEVVVGVVFYDQYFVVFSMDIVLVINGERSKCFFGLVRYVVNYNN